MYIATASTTVKFHEFPSGNVVHNYQPGKKAEGSIRSISWSKDGNWLALVPFTGATEIVSVRDQLKLMKTIQDVEEPTCAAFQNGTKRYIAMGTKSGLIVIYDVKSKNIKKRISRVPSQITHIQFTANDSHCVAACKNGDVLLYNNVTNSPPNTLRIPRSNTINCLNTSKIKRNLIMGGSNEGMVAVWDSNLNKCKFQKEAHKAPINSVVFSPVNADLIVSTGSDRECYFFDISDNKCIANIPVENSITAIDFSPDGAYFVMAGQNGSIYIHDSRNIQQPVHAFQAHTTSIKHLAFQNVSEPTNSSGSIISPEITPVHSSENLQKLSSDLFFAMPNLDSREISEAKQSSGSLEAGDSFLAALGLDKNNSIDSPRYDETKLTSRVTKLPFIGEYSPIVEATKVMPEPVEIINQHFSSTPKESALDNQGKISFINNQTNLSGAIDIQSAVKDIVKEEFRNFIGEIKTDIKYEGMHTTHQLRSVLLDMQMAMVKEFIKIENYHNEIKDLLRSDSERNFDLNGLIEQNDRLKGRVEYLEEQLRSINSNKSDTMMRSTEEC